MSRFKFASRTAAMIVLSLLLFAVPAAAQTAQDHRANRIEPFRQPSRLGEHGPACTADRIWCAELVMGSPEGRLTLVIAPGEGLSSRSPTYVYVLPPDLLNGGSVSIWDRMVIEANGAVMVGLDLSKETRRSGFRSYQRRLLLVRAGPESGNFAVPVLEAPLSGHVELDACSPSERTDDPNLCTNRFHLSSLFTLVPNLGVDRPDLVMVVTASTSPGRRRRSDGPRTPVERVEGDITPDPACTYTRSFYFSEALGRYVPDAPVPECPDFLEL